MRSQVSVPTYHSSVSSFPGVHSGDEVSKVL